MPHSNTFFFQEVDASMAHANTVALERWVNAMQLAAKDSMQQFHQMFHFFEKPEEVQTHNIEVKVEQPSTRPCKFLSEVVRESKETELPNGTVETCAHPNHEELLRLRRIVLGLSSMLRILVNRSRYQFYQLGDIKLDPSVRLVHDISDMGGTIEEAIKAALEPKSPENALKFLEQGILNVCHALDEALRTKGRVAKFSSNNNQMTDHFTGTSK